MIIDTTFETMDRVKAVRQHAEWPLLRLLLPRPRQSSSNPIQLDLAPADKLELALLYADENVWAAYSTAIVDPETEGMDDPLVRQWAEELFGDDAG